MTDRVNVLTVTDSNECKQWNENTMKQDDKLVTIEWNDESIFFDDLDF